MWFKEWAVLVVDDEPDILRLSEMVFRHLDVEGVPVRVYTAGSKAEAIHILQHQLSEPAGPGLLTVALIDVVMETDTAGLELCEFIRNMQRNSFAQLYIRTGQPGVAPERDVIDRYDISGYFTKIEATEDKLYSIVKSGIRQYLTTSFSMVNAMMLNDIVASSMVSQQQIVDSMMEKLTMISQARGVDNVGLVIWIDDDPLVLLNHDADDAEMRRSRLLELEPMPLSPMGETVREDRVRKEALLDIPGSPGGPSIQFLGTGTAMPTNDFIYVLLAWTMHSLSLLWQAAGERTYAGD